MWQQAIAWAKIDPDLCCLIMVSLGHNELTHKLVYLDSNIWIVPNGSIGDESTLVQGLATLIGLIVLGDKKFPGNNQDFHAWASWT